MLKRFKKFVKNQKGLTLVELLAVIVILGIIAAIAVPSIGGIIENSKTDAHIANAKQLVAAAKLAEASNLTTEAISHTLAGGTSSTSSPGYKLSTLVSNKYITDITDPDQKTSVYLGDSYVLKYNNKYYIFLDGNVKNVGAVTLPVEMNSIERTNVN
ncbi:type II secretion system protein [Peribacillus alkalitolerans]|uniref:type II secretion system protein n=1 Tax=Peribacillus alkalitolerans TaxID=1550385 RepID=UPI0013D75CBF|nr:prepilin-type N-terminal cleavage/methylation domain-containing protein [Peribacillus alkalitolerans]